MKISKHGCLISDTNNIKVKRAKTTTDYEMESNSNELLQPLENEKFVSGLSILANTASNATLTQMEDRLEYLKTIMSSKMINAFNARDKNSLKSIIDDVFLADCKLRTSALSKEVKGRDKVYQFFESYLEGCPDVMMTCVSSMQFNVRVISFMYSETGRSDFNVPDDLFDYFKHGSDRDSSILLQKSKGGQLRKSPVSFTTTSYVNFILNKDLTHVEKYIHACKEIVTNALE